MKRLGFLLIPLVLLGSFACRQQEKGDLVLYGGTIYTMSEKNPVVEGVVVKAGKIAFTGTKEEVSKWIGNKTEIIDLKGRAMTPGFIEGHAHLMEIGYNEMKLDLTRARSFDEIIEMVKAAAAKSKPGDWILGEGWHQDKWESQPQNSVEGFPVHHALSAASPDNPVFLGHASGHAAFANARAMELAGVKAIYPEGGKQEVQGGEILRDINGNPTGLFNERAMELVSSLIPEEKNGEQALTLALQACLRNGITSFHDAGVSRQNIELYRQFRDKGKLHTRLYVMVTGFDRDLVHEFLRKGPEIDPEGRLTIRSVKLNCDGALGSRGAWLIEPYTDRPDTHGMPTLPMDTVLATSRLALKSGFQVCSHAIGDRANREILDRYEQAMLEHGERVDHRFRIEHAQHLHPDDISRFAALGVVPAMQAIHMSSDRPWAIDRLGEKRIREGAYMWQALLKSGARIVNGTDAPVEPLNPVASFYASVTRQTLKGQPPGGYEPQQKMTRGQALKSYTLDAAYGAFEEKIKGSIEPGKLADFTVFSKDLMRIPEHEILSAEAVMTIVGGKVLFRKD